MLLILQDTLPWRDIRMTGNRSHTSHLNSCLFSCLEQWGYLPRELTTGVAHEHDHSLNDIGLFVGNAIDLVELGKADWVPIWAKPVKAMQQVRKATEISSHRRTFGQAAAVSFAPITVKPVIAGAGRNPSHSI